MMRTLDHFDLLAPYYDRFAKPSDPERLIELLNLPVVGRLVDVGGGTGRVSNTLKKYVTFTVVADLSVRMLRQARSKDGLHEVCGKSEGLPFEDETFERAIMVDALHHVFDFRMTANEMWRVIKPGGVIVIEEPDIRSITVKFMALFEKLVLMRSHFISPAKIAQSYIDPQAKGRIVEEGITAWIVIEKSVS